MVRRAEQHKVVEVRGSTAGPPSDVMRDQVCLPRAAGESAATIAPAQGASLLAGSVTCSAAEVEGPTVTITQPHLCRCLAEQPQNGCARDLTAAFDGCSGRACEPRCLRDRLAALRMGGPIRGRWPAHGTGLVRRRLALTFCLFRRFCFFLPFCFFEHGGFGVDDHLVHLGFICRWRLTQETLGHEHNRVGLGTPPWFGAREFLCQAKLLGRLNRASVIIENLGAGGSKRRVENGSILRRKPHDEHD
jgi:hypothetical protein